MFKLKEQIKRFLRSEDGPTATEYAIMLALIAMAVVVAMRQFGEHVSGIYVYIDGTMPTT
ncbi:MAG: Flp family type IVb pilin [bacterium]|nr:Flp family type IVb pilin [bacterium]